MSAMNLMNRFPTWRGGFCTPGTGGAITGATEAVPIQSMGTAIDVGPLTSSPSGRGQSSGGALWTPPFSPGDGQTNQVYSNNPVLHLYISCYVTVNKPVLSYLSLRLLPRYSHFVLINLIPGQGVCAGNRVCSPPPPGTRRPMHFACIYTCSVSAGLLALLIFSSICP
jgi:hypothetical protein